MCNEESCYVTSKEKFKICVPYFDKEKPNGLTVIQISLSSHIIIIGLIIIWLFLSIDEIYVYFGNRFSIVYPKNKKTSQELIRWFLSRTFSVLLFSIPVIVLTANVSKKVVFCLMNREESICANTETYLDCFKDKSDFSGFVKIG